MSGTFPILRDSPPPFEPPSMENGFSDDDDDFGNFTGVTFNSIDRFNIETANESEDIRQLKDISQTERNNDQIYDRHRSHDLQSSLQKETHITQYEQDVCDQEKNVHCDKFSGKSEGSVPFGGCEGESELSAKICSEENDNNFDGKSGTIGHFACTIVDSITLANFNDSKIPDGTDSSVGSTSRMSSVMNTVESLSDIVSNYITQCDYSLESNQQLSQNTSGTSISQEPSSSAFTIHSKGQSDVGANACISKVPGDTNVPQFGEFAVMSEMSNSQIDDSCNAEHGASSLQNGSSHLESALKHDGRDTAEVDIKYGSNEDEDCIAESEEDKEKSDDSLGYSDEVPSRIRLYSEDEDLTFRVSVSDDIDSDVTAAAVGNEYEDFASFPISNVIAANDNWANFYSSAELDASFSEEMRADDDFGDFSETVVRAVEKEALDDNGDDFGDFTEIRPSPSTVIKPTPSVQPPLAILTGCFPAVPPNNAGHEIQMDLLYEFIKKEGDIDTHTTSDLSTPGWSKDTRSGGKWMEDVWSRLADIENAMTYLWNESCSNKKLFRTLNIDARNILHLRNRRQLVPLFASNLGTGVLEPTKDVGQSKPKSEHMLVDTNKPPASASPLQGIRPIEFDWSGSGLTNPLETPSSHFLELNMPLPSSTQSSNDLLYDWEWVFKPLSPVGERPQSHKPLQRVEPTIKQAVDGSSVVVTTHLKGDSLSEEALNIISSLPDLSFMKTGVLMFPIK